MTCPHSNLRSVAVVMHPTQPGEPHRAVWQISCQDCAAVFRFVDGDGAICFNDDRTRMEAWVVEAEKGEG
jgi:hypothetical protein